MIFDRPDRSLIDAIHRIQRNAGRRGPLAWLDRLRGKLAYRFWTIASASDISPNARIDPSARFLHLTGVVIHCDAVVEADCLVMQQVTLGLTRGTGAPRLCRGAFVGAGAKILGGVTIGAGAWIGANAVVLSDVPAGATAVGIPARIVRQRTPLGLIADEPRSIA